MSKLGEITVNGHRVGVFRPPHEAPDFPWVDVEELAAAFMPQDEARQLAGKSREYGGDHRVYATARNGDRIAIIVCHALAQGLCGAIDHWNGHMGEAEDGPALGEYCSALGKFAVDHWPMSFEDIVHAFKNPGGEFLRSISSEEPAV